MITFTAATLSCLFSAISSYPNVSQTRVRAHVPFATHKFNSHHFISFPKSFTPTDSPRRINYLHWISWLIAMVGVFMVLFAHGHYTIDILIAYYITTRLFWTYHTLTNNTFLIKVNLGSILSSMFEKNNRHFQFMIRLCSFAAFWCKQLFVARMVVPLFQIL